jgi:putative PIG3 family NAD(P)H quinone oxidoreductase
MRAVFIREPGGPDVLEIREAPAPKPAASEILVRVHASGLNRADILQRLGRYPAPPGVPPDIPGLEYAGVVESVGVGTTQYQAGDKVMGLVAGGACAEFLVTHEALAMPIPDELDMVQAAAVPEAFVTAFDAAVCQGGLGDGDWLAIRAVTSGVGTAALQIAQATGATVIGSTRSEDKLARLEALGLEHRILGGVEELADAIANRRPEGVDVVLDLVGGPGVDAMIGRLRSGGRLMVVGLMGGIKTEINLARLLAKRAILRGTVLRSRPLSEKVALMERFQQDVLPLFSAGQLRPVIDRAFPWGEVQAAHSTMASNVHVGKIVLEHRNG